MWQFWKWENRKFLQKRDFTWVKPVIFDFIAIIFVKLLKKMFFIVRLISAWNCQYACVRRDTNAYFLYVSKQLLNYSYNLTISKYYQLFTKLNFTSEWRQLSIAGYYTFKNLIATHTNHSFLCYFNFYQNECLFVCLFYTVLKGNMLLTRFLLVTVPLLLW